MAELATIARPYAEALYRAAASAEAGALVGQVNALAAVAANPGLRQFAGHPRAVDAQVYELITGVAGFTLDAKAGNLLRAVIENGRLAALPEIAAQFQALVNAGSGVSDATIHSAFPIDEAQLAGVVSALERRYARKLNARVEIDPDLIGGIRVVVGDEVLDTSVRARLEQMKIALTA
jgi:F-type H+-transporting ATPase subunit delta